MGKQSRAIIPRIVMVMIGMAVLMAIATVLFGLISVQHRGSGSWVWGTLLIVFALLVFIMLVTHGVKRKTVQRRL